MTGLTLALYRARAALSATERYFRLRRRYPQALKWLRSCRGGAWRTLRAISLARLVQRSHQDPAANPWGAIVQQVSIEGEDRGLAAGRLIALFHSPGDSLLARFAASQNLALVLANKGMAPLLGDLYVRRNRTGLRKLVRHLKTGGRVAIMMDWFAEEGDCAARFLGVPVRVRSGAVRLAACARVPVVPLVTTYARGCLRLRFGPVIPVGAGVEQEGQGRACDPGVC